MAQTIEVIVGIGRLGVLLLEIQVIRQAQKEVACSQCRA